MAARGNIVTFGAKWTSCHFASIHETEMMGLPQGAQGMRRCIKKAVAIARDCFICFSHRRKGPGLSPDYCPLVGFAPPNDAKTCCSDLVSGRTYTIPLFLKAGITTLSKKAAGTLMHP